VSDPGEPWPPASSSEPAETAPPALGSAGEPGETGPRAAVVAAAATTVLLWASAFVGIRSAGHHFGPGELALGRLVVGALALGALMLVRREPLPPRRALPGIAVCGLLWFGAYNVALNAAERYLDAGIAALLVNVGPIFIAILAGLILREGFPRLLLIGCVIAFTGAALIGLASAHHTHDGGLGAALCIVAALAYAAGVVAQKPVLRYVSPLAVTWLACVIGAVGCLPFAPALVDQAGRAPAGAVAWTIYLGLAPTAVGFLTWAYALSHTSAGRMGSTTYLVPPVALILGWVLLGEVPPLLALPGGILCLTGVALARWQPRRRRPAVPGYPRNMPQSEPDGLS
jgi:drug/metabolite transporter (DMT)-like permease